MLTRFAARKAHLIDTYLGAAMSKFLILTTLSVSLMLGIAHANEEKAPHKNKMGQCQAQAGGKKGDERKAFMKECLSAKASPADGDKASDKNPEQAAKTKACKAQAKGLKGDERKAKISECLKA
jgi:psiF repeat